MQSFKKFITHPTYKDAIELCKVAHKGQMYGSHPYWTHPVAVAEAGMKIFGSKFNNDCKIAAILHDTIEDTPLTRESLLAKGFSPSILDIVDLVTKDKSLTYAENIQKIISSGNRSAMMVKYADNYINFTGDKTGWDPTKKAHSQNKYRKSIETIGAKLGIKSGLSESLATRYVQSINALGEALDVRHDWTISDAQF